MLVVCPKCSSSYLVRADQIGTLGRAVRCGACKTHWVAMPDAFDLGEELDLDTTMQMSDPQLSADELDASRNANAKGLKGFGGRNGNSGSSLYKIVGIFVSIVALGVVVISISDVRTQVSEAINGVVDLVAKDVNAGLSLTELKSEFIEEKGLPFLKVEGQIISTLSEPRKLPPIEIVVLSESKAELYRWVIDPPKEAISAGTPVPFSALLNSPPPESKEVAIRFGTM